MLTWKNSTLSREEIARLDGSEVVDFKPKKASNAKRLVVLKPVEEALESIRFESLSDAARYLVSGAGNLSIARSKNRPIKGFWILEK